MKNKSHIFGVFTSFTPTLAHRLTAVPFAVALALMGAAAQASDALDKPIKLSIPANTRLEDALLEWGNKTGVQVMIDSPSVAGVRTQSPIVGTQPAHSVLISLLGQAKLSYTMENTTVHVVQASDSGSEPQSSSKDNTAKASNPQKKALAGAGNSDTDARHPALDEVIVTAQKREERIQDVPISITALNEQALERLGAKDINDIVRGVPNLMRQSYADGSNFISIRGITSNIGSPTVGVYVDETPIQVYQHGFEGNANPEVFDLDRVEVLRGPQGTLYGASSMGGTIRYITVQPGLHNFSARAVTEVAGTRGGEPSWQTAAAAGGPLKEDEIGYRASVYYRSNGGYIDKIDRATGAVLKKNINSDRVLALRGAVTAELGDTLNATLSTFYQQIERDGLPTYENPPGPFKEGMQVARTGRDHFFLPSLKIGADLGSVSLTSVTSLFRRKDQQLDDYSSLVPEYYLPPTPPFIGIEEAGGAVNIAKNEQRNFSQEIRFASYAPQARVQWVIGGFYQSSKLRFEQDVVEHGLAALLQSTLGESVDAVLGSPLLPGDLSYLEHTRIEEEQLAGFGELNFKLTPKIELIAGARVSRDKTTTQVVADGPLNNGPTPPDQAVPFVQKETPVTPRFGANLHLTPDNLAYATISRGFRTGGGNSPVPSVPCAAELAALGLTQAPNTYSSDKTKNYEIGYKGTSSQHRVSLSAALFRIDWTGIQQNVILATCGFGFIGNLGRARSQGFDFDFQAEPLTGLFLNGALGYTDAKFVKTISLGPGASVVSDGDRVPYTPKWTGTAGAEQRFVVAENTLYLRLNYEYRGNITTTVKAEDVAANPFLYRQGGYGYLSARGGVTRSNWDLALFVDNLADARPLILRDGLLNPVTHIRLREQTLRPRTIGVTFSANF